MGKRTEPRPSDSAATTLQTALALHRQGRLAEAEAAYRALLRRAPGNFNALHLLGIVRLQERRFDQAVDLIGQALAVDPSSADALCNLGKALRALHRYEEAVASYRRAVSLRPDHVAAHTGLGNALMQLRRPGDAAASYRNAIAARPDHAEAHSNLGNALNALDDREAALASYRQALAIRPDFAEAHSNLANVLKALGRFDEALSCYRRAIEIRPDYAEAHNNLGNTLADLNRHDDAVASFDRALALRPDYAEAHCHRGDALVRLRRHAAAADSFRRALALRPDYAEAHARLGHAEAELGHGEAAVASYRQALAHRPDIPFALGDLAEIQRRLCDWAGSADTVREVVDGVRNGRPVSRPFALMTLLDDADVQFRCARTYARARFGARADQAPPRRNRTDGRRRLAYLSADYHENATAHLAAGLFERHDRTRFEVFAFSFGPDDGSPMRRRLERGFEHFLDVRRLSDVEVAHHMDALEIDIAVDLKGYTQGARPGILAHRPAPVQVSYLGFPGTMGTDFIDYVLVDRFVVPMQSQERFSENLVHLPDSYQVNDGDRAIGRHTPSRADCGLPETGFVFCCFNRASKIAPPVFDIWMRLLTAVPGSVLWLIADTAVTQDNLRREAGIRGVNPERLVFAPHQILPEHLARHRVADLFLDTLPYNAHTTASDALWAGLPVLTCAGQAFAGRVAGSLLQAVGLPDLVTDSLADYEALARALAEDPERLGGLRRRLQDSLPTAPLFDTDRFRRNVEAAYDRMWQIWTAGERPRPFTVG